MTIGKLSSFNSKPGKYLLAATMATIGVTLIIPWTPLATLIGFQPLPLGFTGDTIGAPMRNLVRDANWVRWKIQKITA